MKVPYLAQYQTKYPSTCRGYATHRFAYRSKDDTVQGHATALAKFMLSAIDAERQQQQFTCSERTEVPVHEA